MVQVLLFVTGWLILLLTHWVLNVSSFTLYKVGGLYLKTKSPLVLTAISRSVCGVRCKEFPKCHGFSFVHMECVIADSPNSWKNTTTQNSGETWMRMPLVVPKESTVEIQCPSDFVYDEDINFCFKLMNGAVQYEHARRVCAQAVDGGKLASLDEPAKHQSIKKYMKVQGGNFGWVRIAGHRNSPAEDYVLENGHILAVKGDAWCMNMRRQWKCLSLNSRQGGCFDDSSCIAYQACVCEKTK